MRKSDQACGAGAHCTAQYTPHHHGWLVAERIDEGVELDPGSAAASPQSQSAAAADSVCGLRCVAEEMAGRERSAEAATGVLAGETGRCCGESGSGDGLSQAECAKPGWG